MLHFITISPDKEKHMKPAYEKVEEWEPIMWVKELGKSGNHPHWHILTVIPAGLVHKDRMYKYLGLSPANVMIKSIPITKTKMKYYYIGYMTKEQYPTIYVQPSNRMILKGQAVYTELKAQLKLPKGAKGTELAKWIVEHNLTVDQFILNNRFDVYDPQKLEDLVYQHYERVRNKEGVKQLTLTQWVNNRKLLSNPYYKSEYHYNQNAL